MKKEQEVILHGEAMVFDNKIPKQAKAVDIKDNVFIVSASETAGNHHVIEMNDGVEIFKHKETFFMKTSEPTKIKCLHPNRHNEIEINPGTYEFDIQEEYDPFAARMQKARD